MISKEHNSTITPVLNGLVLAGGKSQRMGHDKGKANWHDKEQRYYMADMLKNLCADVFISCRAEQQHEIDDNYKTLPDSYTDLGAYGAILSAFKSQLDKAWLVVACDLPLLDIKTLQYLIKHRNTSVTATTFESPYDGLPEPLIAIWEPRSYEALLTFSAEGITCPRKALRKSEISLLKAENADALMNVNTPEDAEKAKNILHQQKALLSQL